MTKREAAEPADIAEGRPRSEGAVSRTKHTEAQMIAVERQMEAGPKAETGHE